MSLPTYPLGRSGLNITLIITYDGEVKHARTRDALQKAEAHAETVA
jgi:hypothetical protein